MRERAMNLIRDDDTDTHNPRINHSHTFTAVHKKSDHGAQEICTIPAGIVTRTLKEDDKFQASHVLTRKKVYDAVNQFPDVAPLITLVLMKECSTMRREMIALDKLSICELHDKCLFIGISNTDADECLNTITPNRAHMQLVDLIVRQHTDAAPYVRFVSVCSAGFCSYRIRCMCAYLSV